MKAAFGDPFTVQWHLDDRCNQACRHCYREGPPRASFAPDARRRLLDEITTFIAARSLPGRIHFAGGEPFACDQLLELAEAASERGLAFRILSNGTLVTDEAARRLAPLHCHGVQISLEGPEPVHDGIRGPGAFQSAITGASRLKTAGIPVTFAMTLHRGNATYLRAMADLAAAHADRLYVSRLVPLGRGSGLQPLDAQGWRNAQRELLALSREGLVELALRDPTFRPHLAAPWHAARAGAVAGCALGRHTLTVEADGTIYPCRRLPIRLGQWPETSLEAAWAHSELEQLRNRDRLEGACGRCAYRWVCGGCRAIPFALSGRAQGEDPHCAWGVSRLSRLSLATGHAWREFRSLRHRH